MENYNNKEDAARHRAGEDYHREQPRFMENENRLINHGPTSYLARDLWGLLMESNKLSAEQAKAKAKEAAKHG